MRTVRERKEAASEMLLEPYGLSRDQAARFIRFGWSEATESVREECSREYREAREDGVLEEFWEEHIGDIADHLVYNYVGFNEHLAKLGKPHDEEIVEQFRK